MKRRTKTFAHVSLAGALLYCLAVCPVLAGACPKADFRVVIDVGHSREAPGATSAHGRPEYEFNLRTAGLLEARLKEIGFAQAIIWVSPGPLSLISRAAAENNRAPDLLVSIHHDSVQRLYLRPWEVDGKRAFFSDHAKGWSLFVSTMNAHAAESARFAKLVADRLLAVGLPFSTHHAERLPGENRSFIDRARGIYRYDGLVVLKHSAAPAVLLEAGVIVNPSEEAALAARERLMTTVSAIASAVETFCADSDNLAGRNRISAHTHPTIAPPRPGEP